MRRFSTESEPRSSPGSAAISPGPVDTIGLTTAEAADRLRELGPNELPSTRRRSVARIAWEIVSEPMVALLFATAAVYLLLGDTEEAFLLLASILVVVGIDLYQERRTERTLEALRDLSSPRALVIRDGQRRRIPGREVFPTTCWW